MSQCRFLAGFVLILGLVSLLPAQAPPKKDKEKEKKEKEAERDLLKRAEKEYRTYFKKPETAPEFWAAMNYEIEVGKFDLAGLFLRGLLDVTKDKPEDLLAIEREAGLAAFLRLRNIEAWNNDPKLKPLAPELIERVSKALKAFLRDPERIHKFIRNLNATEEERAFAIVELRRSGVEAAPYLIDALRENPPPEERVAILSALPLLNRDIVPPLMAALDVEDPILRLDLIDFFVKRNEGSVVPRLWFLSASPKIQDSVRKQALEAILHFQRVPKEKLPDPKTALTAEAERYYRHRVAFPEKDVTVWKWDGKTVTPETMSVTQAEEHYGLRYARQALALDLKYEPAQIVFLSLALEKGYERGGLNQPLPAQIKELMKIVDPKLVMAVLDRGMKDRRLPVILGSVRTLGDLGEVRASRPESDGHSILVKALNYPDRRVQLAAAESLLRIPTPPPGVVHARIVEILRRAAAAEPTARALVADSNVERGQALGKAVRAAGYEPVVVLNGKDALRHLNEAADIDIILVDQGITSPELPNLLAQLRSDINFGLLPVLVTMSPQNKDDNSHLPKDGLPAERVEKLERALRDYRNVWIEPVVFDKEILKDLLKEKVQAASGTPLTDDERKVQSADAMLWLKRLSVGEIPGFDVRPAEGAIIKGLHSDELAALAIEAASRLPSRNAQRELAALVINKDRPANLRIAAAQELNRSIQKHGIVLANQQVDDLERVFDLAEEPQLRGNVAALLGSLRPNSAKTGERLQRYIPSTMPKEK